LKNSIVAGFAFNMKRLCYVPPRPVAPLDWVEESLIKKLQLLDDFSKTANLIGARIKQADAYML